jgi:hypothetical protein
MEADSQLAGSPVAVRALTMVGALRSAGDRPTVDGTASIYATEVGPWWFQGVDGSSFPKTYEVYANAGQRVRFASWMTTSRQYEVFDATKNRRQLASDVGHLGFGIVAPGLSLRKVRGWFDPTQTRGRGAWGLRAGAGPNRLRQRR